MMDDDHWDNCVEELAAENNALVAKLPKFQEKTTCIKCLEPYPLLPKYKRPGRFRIHSSKIVHATHCGIMLYTCPACGFSWATRTADSV